MMLNAILYLIGLASSVIFVIIFYDDENKEKTVVGLLMPIAILLIISNLIIFVTICAGITTSSYVRFGIFGLSLSLWIYYLKFNYLKSWLRFLNRSI